MIEEVIQQLNAKEDMDFLAMKSTLEAIMSGEVDDLLIEAFLIGLNEKGVKEIEITAAASVMKEKSLTFQIGDGSHIDTCGTGGTGIHTFNCSTASSFVASAGGAYDLTGIRALISGDFATNRASVTDTNGITAGGLESAGPVHLIKP